MKSFFKLTLAVVAIVAGLSVQAYAQGVSAPQTTPMQTAPATKKPPGPCATEHHNVLSACRNAPCTAACKQAHEAMKACRAANNLPPPRHKKTGQNPCKANGAPGSSTQGSAPPPAPAGNAPPPVAP